jgi:mannose-6-phosphate isomerase-like protein (cupin superfamily)
MPLRTRIATAFFIVCSGLIAAIALSPQAASPSGRVVHAGGGDHVVRRWGPKAAALINPDNAGSKDFVVIAEQVPPEGSIPVHKHPHSEELLILTEGAGTVVIGDSRYEVKAGSTAFVPRDEWHGLENHGRSPVAVTGVFSAPGYHTYFAATSVPDGQPVVPFSPSELREVRERFKNVIVFKEP